MNDEMTNLEQVNEEKKERHGCVTALLYLTGIGCLFSVFRYLLGLGISLSPTDTLSNGILAILCVVHVLGIGLLIHSKKVGFYLMAITFILSTLDVVFILNFDAIWLVCGFIASGVWWAVLQIRKNGVSAWKLLTNGWDFQTFRGGYIVCGIAIVLIAIITPIVAGHTEDVNERLRNYMEEGYGSEQDSGYNSKKSNNSTEKRIDPEEAKRKKTENFLRKSIEEANEDLPEDLDDGMVMKKIYLQGDYVMYTIEVDEDLYDIELLNDGKDNLKSILKENLQSDEPQIAYFSKLFKNAHKGICYKYVGGTSGKVCIVWIPYSELIE